jgi:VanZ family protein
MSFRDRVLAWAPAVVWALVIFFMSTEEMAARHTRTWLAPIVRFFFPSVGEASFELGHAVVRKLAHVAEYFVFALLLERGWRRGSMLARARTPIAAFAVAALYSLTDEAHQTFVAARTASLRDCGLDSLGAAIAARVVSRRRSRLGASRKRSASATRIR